jgi:hypothetical protein
MSYHPIILAVAAEYGIEPSDVLRSALTKAHRGARYKAAFLMVTETDLSLREIARELEYKDWSGVNGAVARHCVEIGIEPRTSTELRGSIPPRAVNWSAVAKHLCEHYRAKDFRTAGVSRMTWMRLMRGQRVNADDFLIAFAKLGMAIESYATAEYLAIKRPS